MFLIYYSYGFQDILGPSRAAKRLIAVQIPASEEEEGAKVLRKKTFFSGLFLELLTAEVIFSLLKTTPSN